MKLHRNCRNPALRHDDEQHPDNQSHKATHHTVYTASNHRGDDAETQMQTA